MSAEQHAWQDGSGARDREAKWAAREQYEQDSDAEWLRVSALPGTCLRLKWDFWTSAGKTNISISDSEGQLLMSCRRKTWTFANGQELRTTGQGREWVNATTGEPVLRMIGAHSYRKDDGGVLFPDQRWLRLPVQGSRFSNGVMSAVNESGNTLLWFRKIGWTAGNVEVIVSPACDVTPDILCVIALAGGRAWLRDYFVQPGGGG